MEQEIKTNGKLKSVLVAIFVVKPFVVREKIFGDGASYARGGKI